MNDNQKNNEIIDQKIIDSMKQFAENYAKSTDNYFCIDFDGQKKQLVAIQNLHIKLLNYASNLTASVKIYMLIYYILCFRFS